MKIRFTNFWSSFDPMRSLVGEWCWAATGGFEPVVGRSEHADFEVCSVNSFSSLPARAGALFAAKWSASAALRYRQSMHYGLPYGTPRGHAPRIWYTGENLRPPTGFDLTLSFDLDEYDGTNIYTPFWLDKVQSDIGLLMRPGALPAERLLGVRSVADIPGRFCAVVMSNPHPLRMRAIHALEALESVDVYGRAFGRPITDKRLLLSDYRFCISFENDLFPGYVTEKVVDAWAATAVPLWWGSDPAGYLNPRSMLNLADIGSLSGLVESVRELEHDHSAWAETASQPLLLKAFDHQPVVERIKERISAR